MLRYLYCCLLLLLLACNRQARPYDFPRPVDTTDRPIELQEKKTYAFADSTLLFDNQFAAARLSGVEQVDDSTYRILILPENEPINPSPWYAMRIRSVGQGRVVNLRFAYPAGVRHRYYPKISYDRTQWMPVDSQQVSYTGDSSSIEVRLALREGTNYLAGQEIISTQDVNEWAQSFRSPYVRHEEVGRSKLGRVIPVMRISAEGRYAHKPMIVLFSRQHPPEVTGYLALQSFVETILDHPRAAEFLRRYQLLVFPILNPDGVDLGHWRHTAGGIDSNRDWAYYNQPEARQVADYVVRKARKNEAEVVLGMDLHSTYYDVYYTPDKESPPSVLPGFTDAWLRGIEAGIGDGFEVNEDPSPIGRPTSAGWFRTQFNAEGITYEIGDGTDRDFVREKGRVSAEAMIELLLDRY